MSPSRRSIVCLLATAFAGCSAPDSATSSRNTPTATPRESDVRDGIEDARAHLRAAVDAYVSQAGRNATLLDVTATSPETFPRSDVVSECRAAEAAIREARRGASDEQRRTLDELGAAARFLKEAARLQSDLVLAATTLRRLRRAVYAGDDSDAASRQSAIERTLEESNAHADSVAACDPETVAGALDALDAEGVRSKQAQFVAEDRDIWYVSSALDAATSGLSALDAGWTAWNERAVEDAEREFELAVEDFVSARHHLDEEWSPGFRSFGEALSGVVGALRTGSVRLRDAATESRAGNASAAARNVERARTAFRENETVRTEVRAVEPIVADD